MIKILVYKSILLEKSETFILAQLRNSDKKLSTVLGGEVFLKNALALPEEKIKIGAFWGESISRLYRKISIRFFLTNYLLMRVIKKNNFNLVHAHFATEAAHIFPTIKNMGIPMLVTLHGADVTISTEYWLRGESGYFMKFYPGVLEKLIKDENVYFLAVSNYIYNIAVNAGFPKERLKVAYIGIDLNSFFYHDRSIILREKKKIRLLFVGRLVEKKGLEYLIKSINIIINKTPYNVSLDIVGDGPLRNKLENLAAFMDCEINFHGAQHSSYVKNLMKECVVFVLPSIISNNGDQEGLGIVLLEAQAMGLPVVTSRGCATEEAIVDGVTGKLAEQRSPESIAEAVLWILRDNNKYIEISKSARQFVENKFDLKKCNQNLFHTYEEIVKDGHI